MCEWFALWMEGVACWVSWLWLIWMVVWFALLIWVMVRWVNNPPEGS